MTTTQTFPWWSLWDGIKQFAEWVVICILSSALAASLAYIYAVRQSDNPYFAMKIEKGETINWMGRIYKPVKGRGK